MLELPLEDVRGVEGDDAGVADVAFSEASELDGAGVQPTKVAGKQMTATTIRSRFHAVVSELAVTAPGFWPRPSRELAISKAVCACVMFLQFLLENSETVLRSGSIVMRFQNDIGAKRFVSRANSGFSRSIS